MTFGLLKPFQNKKGQKNLRYPKKEQSFSLEKDCFFGGYLNFFGLSYFETALENVLTRVNPNLVLFWFWFLTEEIQYHDGLRSRELGQAPILLCAPNS